MRRYVGLFKTNNIFCTFKRISYTFRDFIYISIPTRESGFKYFIVDDLCDIYEVTDKEYVEVLVFINDIEDSDIMFDLYIIINPLIDKIKFDAFALRVFSEEKKFIDSVELEDDYDFEEFNYDSLYSNSDYFMDVFREFIQDDYSDSDLSEFDLYEPNLGTFVDNSSCYRLSLSNKFVFSMFKDNLDRFPCRFVTKSFDNTDELLNYLFNYNIGYKDVNRLRLLKKKFFSYRRWYFNSIIIILLSRDLVCNSVKTKYLCLFYIGGVVYFYYISLFDTGHNSCYCFTNYISKPHSTVFSFKSFSSKSRFSRMGIRKIKEPSGDALDLDFLPEELCNSYSDDEEEYDLDCDSEKT